MLDPDYKPERVNNYDFTIQRQLSPKVSFEVGYMGKLVRTSSNRLTSMQCRT